MEFREYSPLDRQACVEILESNTPEFFVETDGKDYATFLDHLPGPYYVVSERGRVVGCGGWALDSTEVAALTWGMVRRDSHRRGLGRELLHRRLSAIRDDARAGTVRIRTVQLVQTFYQREGFTIVDVVPNGFGEGLDRVTMDLHLGEPTARSK
jgi:predicted GNAT family N-acyltransferase